MANIVSPTSGDVAEVNSDLQLLTSSVIETEQAFFSEKGLSYTANSHDATAAAGTYIFYFQNTDTARS